MSQTVASHPQAVLRRRAGGPAAAVVALFVVVVVLAAGVLGQLARAVHPS